MRQFIGWRAVLGVLVVGCTGTDVGNGVPTSTTSQAVTQCDGDGDGKPPTPCQAHKDPAFALGRSACESGRLVGAASNNTALSTDPTYVTTLANEFTYVTPENAMKWGTLQPVDATHWDFTAADQVVSAAQAAHQAIKGHTLVWYQQLPPWVNDSLSPADLQKAINANIDTVVGHYKGQLRAWDVVNEAIDDSANLRDSVFSRAFGSSFIAAAFKRAHKADPKAKLFYNDYGTEVQNAKSDAVYNLVQGLVQANVPIDGVGFQMHLDARFPPSEQAIIDNFARFTALGLRVNISELDVQVRNVIDTRANQLALEKQIYHRVVAACAATPKCEAVTTWGYTDKYSWIDTTFGADDPLEFDENYQRKPAYYGMVDGFEGVPADPDGTPPNLIANGSFEAGTDGWSGFGIPSVSVAKPANTGDNALLAEGRTDPSQGAGIDVTSVVRPGFVYDTSAFVAIKHDKHDKGDAGQPVALAAQVTCDSSAPTLIPIATGTAHKKDYASLDGTLTLPLCNLTNVTLVVSGPPAGVDILVDDAALRQIGEPLGPNVVTNGTFETDISGWFPFGSPTLSQTNTAHTGNGALLATGRTATYMGPGYNLLPPVTTDGATYLMSGWVRVSAASAPVSLTVTATCDGTQTFTQVASGTATNTGFVHLSGSYLVPPCNDLSSLVMYFEGPDSGIDEIVDDVSVQQRLSIPVEPPPPPPQRTNIAGNGDWELGANGWSPFGGNVSQTQTFVHGGSFAGVDTTRTASYMGPSYVIPSGPASYDVSVFALQNSGSAITLALSAKITCNGSDSFPFLGSASNASGTWSELSGSFTIPTGCTSAQIYVQQLDGSTNPDIYVDDLVINPSSVTNFSGNPGFESGTSGWFTFGGGLTQSSAFAHSGSFSGLNNGRTASYNGPAFSFPTGAGTYTASLWALQNSGTDGFPFVLSVKTHCNGADNYPFLGQVNAASGTWVELSGTFTVPANCTEVTLFLNQNGGSTFPDMYVDDLVAGVV
ncbi:MAG TPA: endo-1,4-beta-xylanase, partial [Polyangiaceae bacterium]|nr:endo-1,4-beta-xylanase [Polyangiaceae bacterium]